MSNSIFCDGVIDTVALTCSTGWQVVSAAPFDPATLDPIKIAGAVGVGFFVLVPLWAATIGLKYLIQSIK